MQRPELPHNPRRPIAVLGAGDLVSHLMRLDNVVDDANYEFNAFRICGDLEATHVLRPSDLRNIVKLCQVLAFAIADDGWLTIGTRTDLYELANELDKITQKWSDHDNG